MRKEVIEVIRTLKLALSDFTGSEVKVSHIGKQVNFYILSEDTGNVSSETWNEIQDRVIDAEWDLGDHIGKPDGHLPYYFDAVLVEKFPQLSTPQYKAWEAGQKIVSTMPTEQRPTLLVNGEEYVVVSKNILSSLEETYFLLEDERYIENQLGK